MAPVDVGGGLSAGAWLDLDLLRQRRERFGLERPKVIPVRELLWRGGLIGSVTPLFMLLVVVFLFVQDRQLTQRQRRLEPIAAEHDRVEQSLIAAMQKLEQTRSTNSAIAKAMADVRSSSAVLAEVRRLVPESISVDRLVVKGNVLEISGSAQQPNGTAVGECTPAALVGLWLLCIGGGQTLECCGCWRSRKYGASFQRECRFCGRCHPRNAQVPFTSWCGGDGSSHGGLGAGGFVEVTNFQLKANRPVEAWLTPERAVVVVPILAGLFLAVTLAMAVMRPQLSRLHERRSVVEVMEQKSEALPGLEQALAQRRVDQEEVMAQQQRLLGLIAGTSELETFLAELNDLADEHQVLVFSTEPGAVERAPVPIAPSDAPVAGAADLAVGDPLLMQGLEKRFARIQVEGPFVFVLDFLRSLEKLEVFVVTEDLSVMGAGSAEDQAMKVRLGLTVLAYGVVNPALENGAS